MFYNIKFIFIFISIMLFFSSNLFAKCNIDYLKYKPNLKIEKLLKDKNIPIGISKAYARKKFSYLTRFKSSSDFYFDPNVTSTTGNYCNYCCKNDGFATIDYYNIYSSEGALENMSYCITFDNHQDIYKIYEEFKKKYDDFTPISHSGSLQYASGKIFDYYLKVGESFYEIRVRVVRGKNNDDTYPPNIRIGIRNVSKSAKKELKCIESEKIKRNNANKLWESERKKF